MQVELWPIDRPIPYARNARKIAPENIDSLAGLIKEYGFRVPIIVDEEDVIVAGHTRLLAAQKLGMAEVPVHVAHGLTKTQIRGLRLADNRVQQNTKWDFELLALELTELKEFEFDLSLTAFDQHEIDPLLASVLNPEISDGTDATEESASPDTEGRQKANFISFTDEQFEVICQAIFKLRDMEQQANISEGRALELIAGDWLGGAPLDADASADDGTESE